MESRREGGREGSETLSHQLKSLWQGVVLSRVRRTSLHNSGCSIVYTHYVARMSSGLHAAHVSYLCSYGSTRYDLALFWCLGFSLCVLV